MTIDQKLLDMAHYAAGKLNLPAQFIAAWWISENGRTWPQNNNVGNVSYQGEGIPNSGVFAGVYAVQSNKVCDYDTPEHGVDAFIMLLVTPKADKVLTVDLEDLQACGDDLHAMAVTVGNSNWAESHYDDGQGPGSLIWGVYNSSDVIAAFAGDPVPQTANDTPAPEPTSTSDRAESSTLRAVHYVQPGETLSSIGLRYGVPYQAIGLLSGVQDYNVIHEGEQLVIPWTYTVKSGDTVTAIALAYQSTVEHIAHLNNINPDRIWPGELLYI